MAICSLNLKLIYYAYFGCAVAVIVVLIGINAVLKENMSEKVIIVIITIALVLRILYYMLVGVKQVSDFETPFRFFEIWKNEYSQYEYTNMMSELNMFAYRNYYARFPSWGAYGFVIWALLLVFGNHESIVFLFNVIVIGITIYYLYKVLKITTSKRMALFVAGIYAIAPSMVCWTSISCPDHIILLCTVLFIYHWMRYDLKPEGIKNICFAAFFSGLAVLFKPIMPLFPCILIAGFIVGLKSYDEKDEKIKRLKGIGLFLVVFTIFSFSLKHVVYFGLQKIIKTDIVDSTPYYIAWGYATNEKGEFDATAWDYLIDETKDSSETNEEFMTKLREAEIPLLKVNIPLFPKIWKTKFDILMSDTTFSREWTLRKSETAIGMVIRENSHIAYLFFAPVWLAELILVAFSIFRKERVASFASIGWLGCVCYLVCATVMSRYRMIFMVYHYILVAFGIVCITDLASRLIRKGENK